MAAQAIVVRRAREEQELARRIMEVKVARAENGLEHTPVYIFEVGMLSGDVHARFARTRLKLKFRMGGVTLLKSKPTTASVDDAGTARVNFDAAGSVIYEGGDVLGFDLCQSRRICASRVVATGRLPLSEVVGFTEPLGADAALGSDRLGGPTGGRLWSLELKGGPSGTEALARVSLSIRVRRSRLDAAGGAAALKSYVLPPRPTPVKSFSVFEFAKDSEDCRRYCRQAGTVRVKLQKALETVILIERSSLLGFNLLRADNAARLSLASADAASTDCGSDASDLSLEERDAENQSSSSGGESDGSAT